MPSYVHRGLADAWMDGWMGAGGSYLSCLFWFFKDHKIRIYSVAFLLACFASFLVAKLLLFSGVEFVRIVERGMKAINFKP